MRHQAFLLTVMLIPIITACSDGKEAQSEIRTIGIKPDRAIVQKKPKTPVESLVGIAPVYEAPIAQIDYSKPLTKDLEGFTLGKTIPQTKPSRIFGWEDEIHNKPLSHIKAAYDFNESISTESLVDLISYTQDELDILDIAFPNSINIDVKSIYDGDTILLSKSITKKSDLFKKDKNGDVKVRLMNIDCPEIQQKGGGYAKERLADFLSIPTHVKNDKKPKIKLRFRSTLEQDYPLAIVTIDFGMHEFSINRSMVYSGSCFTYAQYNQDRLLISIEQYANHNKKGIWSKRAALMATEDWIMPWDYRDANISKDD